MAKKQQEEKEIGYFNNSTRKVIPGYNDLYHSLSKKQGETDKDGYVKHFENINGALREIKINLKGQFKLDHSNRGGKRLWERIYTEEDLVEKMTAMGITMERKQKNAVQKTKSKKAKEGEGQEKEVVDNEDLSSSLGL